MPCSWWSCATPCSASSTPTCSAAPTGRRRQAAAAGEALAARAVRVRAVADVGLGKLHWHGMGLPARMDGGPHQLIAPGAIWSPQWTVRQPAATLWYHAHPHGSTADQVYRGDAGMIVVGLSPGETVDLRNYSPDFGDRVGSNTRFGAGDYQVMQLRAAGSLAASDPLPRALASFARTPESVAQRTRSFTIYAQIINGGPVDMGRIDEAVPQRATEIWMLRNRDPQPHNFHVHTVRFQVLDIDGAAPKPELAGWKDTVYLPPGSEVRIIATFPEYADPTWRYMYHCPLLWHEDSGLMGQFVILAPGQTPIPPPDPHDSH